MQIIDILNYLVFPNCFNIEIICFILINFKIIWTFSSLSKIIIPTTEIREEKVITKWY